MQLIPHFQPIISHRDNQVIGYEATIRGLDERNQQHGALQLLATAEHQGKLKEFDFQARDASIHEGISMLSDDQRLFVNISAASLQHSRKWFPDNAPIHKLILEITEHAPIQINLEMITKIERLREKGLKIAIDDFGVGYNSVQMVDLLRPDFLKLDKEIVKGATDKTIRSLISFCRESNIELIAEGVEKREQLNRLLQLGVDYFQGYLFGYPFSLQQQHKAYIQWV